MTHQNFVRTALLATSLIAGWSVSGWAAEDFYKGKTITVIIDSAAGAGYDSYGRAMAQNMPNHIPGHPNMIVQNMPGASGLAAANFMFAKAPKDGTVIAGTHSNIPTAPLMSPEEAKFDGNKYTYIGSITSDPYVGYVWNATSPIHSYEEAKTKQAIMGSSSARSAGIQYALMSNAMFGTKFKLVIGYPSSSDVKLAMERGELHGTFGNSWGSLKTGEPEWLKEKKVTIIIQHGFHRHPDLPDVPTMFEQVKNEDDRQAMALVMASQEFSKPYFGPPGMPADRLAILRQAFDETVKDPKFIGDVAKMNLDVAEPMTGQKLEGMIADLYKTPPSVNKRLEKMFDSFAEGDTPKK
jgi:tripartite-type tricarboxylate transporter receptor subunit TctC